MASGQSRSCRPEGTGKRGLVWGALSGADIRGGDGKDTPRSRWCPQPPQPALAPGLPGSSQLALRPSGQWIWSLAGAGALEDGARAVPPPVLGTQPGARPLTDALRMFAADGCQVERNPMCFMPLSSLQPSCRPALPGNRSLGAGSLLPSGRGSSPLPLAERRGSSRGPHCWSPGSAGSHGCSL